MFIALSLTCYTVSAVAMILLGLTYALRKSLMPYHLEAMETTWEQIDYRQQFMFRNILNGAGYFGMALGIALLLMTVIPFRQGQHWAVWAIPLLGLCGALPLLNIVMKVNRTRAKPPLQLVACVNALFIVGFICSLMS